MLICKVTIAVKLVDVVVESNFSKYSVKVLAPQKKYNTTGYKAFTWQDLLCEFMYNICMAEWVKCTTFLSEKCWIKGGISSSSLPKWTFSNKAHLVR